jgi:Xaa-Pro aminopeptidase
LDYAHGTGHGVGHVLQVHEGPANISKRGNQKLAPGMLLSNEPGYYKEGGWGIRIENLIVVTPPDDNGYMGFETVTFCPIDRRLIMVDMLNDRERAWMDAYHQHTQDLLIDGLQDDTAALKWLGEACAPL